MNEVVKLTPADIQIIKTDRDETMKLIKHYACQYEGGEHYNYLGASCVMSATNTVDTIIGSAQYLNGAFLWKKYQEFVSGEKQRVQNR